MVSNSLFQMDMICSPFEKWMGTAYYLDAFHFS